MVSGIATPAVAKCTQGRLPATLPHSCRSFGVAGGQGWPAPADPSLAGGGGASTGQMVALACMCSSPIIVDSRKRTKVERPDADASDLRLAQRHERGSMQQLRLSPPQMDGIGGRGSFGGLLGGLPVDPLGSAQSQQQMWMQPLQQPPTSKSQFPTSNFQGSAFLPHTFQPDPNAAMPLAQSVPVPAPGLGGALPAMLEGATMLESRGEALIEIKVPDPWRHKRRTRRILPLFRTLLTPRPPDLTVRYPAGLPHRRAAAR